MQNYAVILSGGIGSRINAKIPKQFLKLAGKTILEHSFDAFSGNKNINKIVIVSAPNYLTQTKELIKNDKLLNVIQGGKARANSVYNALQFLNNLDLTNNDNILIHDAARPLVSQNIINNCINNLQTCKAVNVCVPSTNTLIEVNKGFVKTILDRSKIMQVQTPQGFNFKTLFNAYSKASAGEDISHFSDDCSLFLKYEPNHKINIIKGEERNIKVTYQLDLDILNFLHK
jgi:ribitol-5-phosphate 2-dehydrogenase (NADP+) / D-ribitol-5-phosphate cytidylyltransferase